MRTHPKLAVVSHLPIVISDLSVDLSYGAWQIITKTLAHIMSLFEIALTWGRYSCLVGPWKAWMGLRDQRGREGEVGDRRGWNSSYLGKICSQCRHGHLVYR